MWLFSFTVGPGLNIRFLYIYTKRHQSMKYENLDQTVRKLELHCSFPEHYNMTKTQFYHWNRSQSNYNVLFFMLCLFYLTNAI